MNKREFTLFDGKDLPTETNMEILALFHFEYEVDGKNYESYEYYVGHYNESDGSWNFGNADDNINVSAEEFTATVTHWSYLKKNR